MLALLHGFPFLGGKSLLPGPIGINQRLGPLKREENISEYLINPFLRILYHFGKKKKRERKEKIRAMAASTVSMKLIGTKLVLAHGF